MDKFDKWFDNNIDRIIDEYQEKHPELIIGDGDPREYLNMDYVYEYAKEYIYKEDNTPEFDCCICGAHFVGYGNNPWPISKNENDRCCDDCNIEAVIPARIAKL